MRSARSTTFAWVLWSAYVTVAAVGIVLDLRPSVLGIAASATGWGTTTGLILYSALPTVGAVLAARRPENPIGWLLSASGLGLAVGHVAGRYARLGIMAEPELTGTAYAAWGGSLSSTVSFIVLVVLIPNLFPDGRPPSAPFRRVLWFQLADIALLAVGQTFSSGPRSDYPGISNPFGLEGAAGFAMGAVAAIAWVGVLVGGAASIASLIQRFRHGSYIERQQIKTLAFAASVALLSIPLWWLPVPRWAAELTAGSVFVGVPVGVGVAVLRYGLYDIDRLVSRTVTYSVVMLLLVGGYAGVVFFLQLAFAPLTGGSDLAIAASTLAMAALFRPLRSRIRDAVDHRFNRRRYDASRTVEHFGSRLRDQVELDHVGEELTALVRATMQPTHVSLWVPRRSK